MDDMTMLAELGDRLDHEPPATLVRQRHRLLDAVRGRRRRLVRRVLTGGLVAATAAGLAIAAVDTHGVPDRPAAPPAVTLSAMVVLNRAAEEAERLPDVTPTAHQWLYEKLVSYGPTPTVEESWVRFDGRQEAFTDNGHLVIDDTRPLPAAETPLGRYAWARTLPTEPHALLAAMESGGGGAVPPTEKERFLTDAAGVRNIMVSDLPPPALRAALYRMLALLPGVRVEQVTDGSGRRDLGVTDTDGNTVLLLDPTTYQLIGGMSGQSGRPGTVTQIVQALAVVDNAGQR